MPNSKQTLQGGKPFAYPFAGYPRAAICSRRPTGPRLIRRTSARRELTCWTHCSMIPCWRASTGPWPGWIPKPAKPSGNLPEFQGCFRSLRFSISTAATSPFGMDAWWCPGELAAEPAWKELAGANPESPKDFVARLLAKDDGWLAAYFDTLSRLTPAQQVYFTDAHRLPRFYDALRGKDIAPGPARPVFRPDPDLLLLVTRLQLDSSGQPSVPGNLEVWEQILQQKTDSKVVRQWAKRASHWKDPDQLVEAMFAFSRQSSEDGPLPIYLMLSAIDGARPADQRLSPQTVRLLAREVCPLRQPVSDFF